MPTSTIRILASGGSLNLAAVPTDGALVTVEVVICSTLKKII